MKKTALLFSLFALLFAGACMLAGCCASTLRTLDKAKDAANKGDYAAVASMNAACDRSCDGCNQLHLLKGDACYRLAKSGQEPQKRYPCAAAELTEGIGLTKSWNEESFSLNRQQTYTNLCESLRNWRDLSSGSEADAINDRLLASSGRFLTAEPGNPCGVYFQNNALYAKQRPCLLHPETCPDLCAKLQNILTDLDGSIGKPAGTGCSANLKELRSEVAQAKEIGQCR